MSVAAETIGTMALGSLIPAAVPRPLLYVLAIAGVAFMLRKQIRRVLR